MLGRLVLILLQIVVGWWGSNLLMGFVSGVPGTFQIYVFAVVAAIAVYLVGVIGAQVLKDVGTPSGHTLSWALTLAVVAALLWTFGPTLPLLDQIPWSRVPVKYAVLAGAILGYHIKK